MNVFIPPLPEKSDRDVLRLGNDFMAAIGTARRAAQYTDYAALGAVLITFLPEIAGMALLPAGLIAAASLYATGYVIQRKAAIALRDKFRAAAENLDDSAKWNLMPLEDALNEVKDLGLRQEAADFAKNLKRPGNAILMIFGAAGAYLASYASLATWAPAFTARINSQRTLNTIQKAVRESVEPALHRHTKQTIIEMAQFELDTSLDAVKNPPPARRLN